MPFRYTLTVDRAKALLRILERYATDIKQINIIRKENSLIIHSLQEEIDDIVDDLDHFFDYHTKGKLLPDNLQKYLKG